MITAQDIREKTFEKAKMGGYDMEGVDIFLEQIADELTLAQKESAVLKSKMKVLVDKIEEYRSNESALNQAVLSAQKLAIQIEAEAKQKAEEIISEAEATREEKLSGIVKDVEAEQKRLKAAKAESAKFIDGIKAMYGAHLKNISAITDDVEFLKLGESVVTPAPAVEKEPVKEVKPEPPKTKEVVEDDIDATFEAIEKRVSKIEPEPRIKLDLSEDINGIVHTPPVRDDDSTQPFTL